MLLNLKNLDIGSSLVIGITFVMFALALIVKGFTHELFLETGVFLVSVKLIMMSHKSNVMKKSIEVKLDVLRDELQRLDECNGRDGGRFDRDGKDATGGQA